MNDLPTRLRRWTHDVDAEPASDLMDEAAAELERLRWRVKTLESAAKYADTMQRSRAGQKLSESASFCAVCPERESTNLDAAPAARANAESVAPQPTAGDRSGNPTSHSGTGNQPSPPCVEKDGLSHGPRTGQINRTPECESPRRERGESSLRDVPRPDTKGKATGGPEHKSSMDVEELLGELHYIVERGDHVEYDIRRTACEAEHAIDRLRAWVNELQLSKVELDALQHVVEDGRFVDFADYGHLRSLLVRLRPEWEFDRSQPINDERLAALEELSALDQQLELEYGLTGNPMIKARRCKAAKTDTTPQRNGALSDGPDPDSRVWETPCTPPQGSFRDSKNAKEPVAWAVMPAGSDYCVTLSTRREAAQKAAERKVEAGEYATMDDIVFVPLYRRFAGQDATLTDEEREAVEAAAWACGRCDGFNGDPRKPAFYRGSQIEATLRNLLERLS